MLPESGLLSQRPVSDCGEGSLPWPIALTRVGGEEGPPAADRTDPEVPVALLLVPSFPGWHSPPTPCPGALAVSGCTSTLGVCICTPYVLALVAAHIEMKSHIFGCYQFTTTDKTSFILVWKTQQSFYSIIL